MATEHAVPDSVQAYSIAVIAKLEGEEIPKSECDSIVTEESVHSGCSKLSKSLNDTLLSCLLLIEELPESNDDERRLHFELYSINVSVDLCDIKSEYKNQDNLD